MLGTAMFVSYEAARESSVWEQCRTPLWVQVACSGLLAGAMHGALCVPLDLRTPPHAVSWQRGARSAALGMLRDSAGVLAYFGTYEAVRGALQRQLDGVYGREESPSPGAGLRAALEHREVAKGFSFAVPSLVAGGCAGCAHQLASYPIETLRTMQLRAGGSVLQALRQAGVRGMVPPVLALKKSFAPSAVGLCVYEMFKHEIHGHVAR
eukprot:TRINITY_DN45230_c0_g1_i1.p1 TRINITY_DN45230_c0_g1~~TRINITY_DN45230_c0_g1_i1.p1  ORF type:complete len:209 (+),score=58.30 TRINITY_DN45230_c0_g1_i1:170-796(+)